MRVGDMILDTDGQMGIVRQIFAEEIAVWYKGHMGWAKMPKSHAVEVWRKVEDDTVSSSKRAF